MGIYTLYDLAHTPLEKLRARFGVMGRLSTITPGASITAT